MAEFRRELHRRIAVILARMDPHFLADAQCYFGGGTQIVMSHGEFRESRDIDFLVRPEGLRVLRQSVHDRSLGRLFRQRIHLAREVRLDRYGLRTFLMEEEGAEPVKFEIVLEGRIAIGGRPDARLRVPTLDLRSAIAEKLLANADRGRDRHSRSRDVIDLAFFSLHFLPADFSAGRELAEGAYGEAVMRELREVIRMLELDTRYRAECIEELLIEDPKALRLGLKRLQALTRQRPKSAIPATGVGASKT